MQAARVAIVDDERFDAHAERGAGHPERPERLAAARQGLFGALDESTRVLLPAREATDAELLRVHTGDCLRYVQTRLREGYGHLDADTYFAPATREAAWLAAGAAIDLGHALSTGTPIDRSTPAVTAQRGIALLRPPGHHATPDRSMGFCLLNNVALAARSALAAGLSRVAIVDWDVHHGNGTQDAFYDDPRVLFVSLHQFPFYPGTGAPREIGAGAGRGFTANVGLPAGSGDAVYGAAFRQVVLPLLRAHAPELVLVSAGFDAHARDPLASMQLSSATYGAMASALIALVDALGHGRIGFILEGGYDLQALEASVAQVAKSVHGHHQELPEGALRPAEQAAIDATRSALSPFWTLDLHPKDPTP